MNSLRPILLAEDNPNDVELTLTALRESKFANEIVVANDGEQVLDFLYQRGAYAHHPRELPAVILLDLKMPKLDGHDVLRQIRSDPRLKLVPVVVLTSSREERDLHESYDLGANAYVVKPVDFAEFIGAIQKVGMFWGVINEPPPLRAGA